MALRVVTLLTDYGLQDEFAGVCHGVIKRIAPQADVIHVTHGIAPQNVLQGAIVLAETLPYLPAGIHLAIVDPGVGSPRRPVALLTRGGRVLVGPDNGVLLEAASRDGGVELAVELAAAAYRLHPVSATFHGRDVFAPAAAHLVNGVAVEALGPVLGTGDLVRLELPTPQLEDGRIQATVLAIDHFGNVRLNVTSAGLVTAGIALGDPLEIETAGRSFAAVAASTFADVSPGSLAVLVDSSDAVAIAVNRGSAARTIAVVVGQEIVVGARR